MTPAVVRSTEWQTAQEILEIEGVVLVRGALPKQMITDLDRDLRDAWRARRFELGSERLAAAGELGVVRAPLISSVAFREIATHPKFRRFVSGLIGEHAILHLQNGFVLPSGSRKTLDSDQVFQGRWHRDFPRILNKFRVSVNVFLPVTPFEIDTGATQFLLGSHQSTSAFEALLDTLTVAHAIADPCDVLLFDSTIWHRAGTNVSGAERLGLNMQFTLPWIKQQMDLCRLLDEEEILASPVEFQQAIGYFSRVPDSLDAFYQPPEKRYYRSGQG